MAQALLLSDHELISDIYQLNLKVYVDCTVTVKKKAEEAFALLELNPDYDFIITLSNIEGKDVAKKMVDFVESKGWDKPIIVIGEKSEVAGTSSVISMPANLNVPQMVKTVAKILGVTAKDMAEKIVPDFFPIPVKMVKSFKNAPCDIFYKVSKSHLDQEFLKIIEKEQNVEGKVKEYLEKGVTSLFIPASERLNITNAVTKTLEARLSMDLPPQEAIEAAEEGFELVAGEITNSSEVSEKVVNISKKCIETVSEAVKGVPKLKTLLLGMLENKSGYIYIHSVMATYVANHVIKNISWGAEEHAEKVGFVLFFHDMFLGPIYHKYPHFQYEEDLIFEQGLSDKEKEVVVNHARLAGEMVKNFPRCPMGADAIIMQHHGTTNGLGFTMDFKDDISPLAKVIIVSEEFVNELLKQKEEGKRPYHLESIIEHLRNRFTRHTYKKIINTLETISL